jgi:hypothetical protein
MSRFGEDPVIATWTGALFVVLAAVVPAFQSRPGVRAEA